MHSVKDLIGLEKKMDFFASGVEKRWKSYGDSFASIMKIVRKAVRSPSTLSLELPPNRVPDPRMLTSPNPASARARSSSTTSGVLTTRTQRRSTTLPVLSPFTLPAAAGETGGSGGEEPFQELFDFSPLVEWSSLPPSH